MTVKETSTLYIFFFFRLAICLFRSHLWPVVSPRNGPQNIYVTRTLNIDTLQFLDFDLELNDFKNGIKSTEYVN